MRPYYEMYGLSWAGNFNYRIDSLKNLKPFHQKEEQIAKYYIHQHFHYQYIVLDCIIPLWISICRRRAYVRSAFVLTVGSTGVESLVLLHFFLH